MFEIAREALGVLHEGGALGVVVVTAVHGSTPRAPGSAMAVTSDGRALGAISGGCIESEAYELALACLGAPEPVTETLGGEGDLLRPGLACGGAVDVLAFRIGPGDRELIAALEASLADGEVTMTLPGGRRIVRERAPRLVIVGAVDFTPALAAAGDALGYRVVVVDPRPVFATAERVPAAHEVHVAWPDAFLRSFEIEESTVICVLTHDDRVDVPALEVALASRAAYVGAMGSRVAHERRLARLREAGVGDDALARLRSPIGLDLGGSSPAETAVAILAEVIAERAGGTGRRLSELDGHIHRT
ncbi:XdhC family protein [Demequina mangrovi]|uniref:Xanthine dehydrogenase accessory factor n=1 Tax=Demequina mangrovi TaxID=1043493 RepID=A0A1H6XCN2_9MICO|nr:XdhC family protein [Demequina mangrovi]SEJ24367.1 xanthine dehydrogenase accessory factor [Demequina mangrovi]